jgi:hypothetical protein
MSMREKHSLGANKSFTGGNASIMQSLNSLVQSEYSHSFYQEFEIIRAYKPH